MPHPELAAIVPDLVSYARRRGLQPADAEDAAQEAIARLLAEETPRRNPAAWATRILQNLLIDRSRRAARSERHTRQTGPLLQDEPDPSDTLTFAQDMALVARAYGVLGERDAEIVRRLDIDDEDTSTVARDLGMTAAAVRQRRSRAHKAMHSEYLRLGGTAASIVVLFPLLRAAGRLRSAITSSAGTALAFAGLALTLVAVPFTADLPGTPDVQVTPVIGMVNPTQAGMDDLAGSAGTHGPGLDAEGVSNPLLRHVTVRPPSPPKHELIRKCSDRHGKPGVCNGEIPYNPNLYAVGVITPVEFCDPTGIVLGCQKGVVVSQSFVDTTPVCPAVRTVPVKTVCQKGY